MKAITRSPLVINELHRPSATILRKGASVIKKSSVCDDEDLNRREIANKPNRKH